MKKDTGSEKAGFDTGAEIRRIRGDRSQEEFAEMLGVGRTTIIRYENNERAPDAEFLIKLNMLFGADPTFLLLGKKNGKSPNGDNVYQLVPKSSARPSAGHGSLIESEQIVDYMAFKREWLQRVLGISHSDIVLVEVRGDSMAGTLDDGDLALVDMRQNRLDVSAVFVIQVDDALLVKRVQRKLDGTVIIKSDNSAYEPEVLVGPQLASLKVVGRVVWPRLR
jgi:phage repressor protein C with HTH and peptisase S24 domain